MAENSLNILLIEDNPGDARLIQETLIDNRENAVILETCTYLSKGMKCLSNNHFDVVLLDLSLPDSNGFETFAKFHPHAQDIPIIVLTGLEDEAMALRTVREGAQDYLVKGQFDNQLLFRAIRYAIERKRAEHKLHESEAFANTILSSLSSHIAVLDRNGHIIAVNEAWKRFARQNGDPTLLATGIGVNYLEACGKAKGDSAEEAFEALNGVQAVLDGSKREFTLEYPCSSPDEERWFILRASPLIKQEGAVVAHADITTRKQADRELKESEIRYRNLFDDTPISLLEQDFSELKIYLDQLRASGVKDFREHFDNHPEEISRCINMVKLVATNNASLQLYRAKSKQELMGNLDKLFCQESQDFFKQTLISILDGNTVFEGEGVNQTLLGNKIDIHLKWMIAPGQEETWSKVLVSISDITERKRAEAEARREQEKAQQYLDLAEVIMVALDQQGNIAMINRKGCDVLGYEEQALLGKNWFDVALPPHAKEETRRVFRLLLKGDVKSLEYHENEILTKDREERIIAWHNTILRDEVGRIIGALCSGEDITERKRAQEALQKTHVELQELYHQTKADANFRGQLLHISRTLSLQVDLNKTLPILCYETRTLLDADLVHIWLLNDAQKELCLSYVDEEKETGISLGFALPVTDSKAVIARVAQKGKSEITNHIPEYASDEIRHRLTEPSQLQSSMAIPLMHHHETFGVLVIGDQDDPERFKVPDLEKADLMANQIASALARARLFDDLQRVNADLIQAYDKTIEGWSKALDLRDHETEGHSERVTQMTLQLARCFYFDHNQLIHIRRGVLLHDIGKMGIPDHILHKPGSLDEEEWDIMYQHPVFAYEWLKPIKYLEPALDIPYCHHEKWDGSGYPRGLKGEEIPLPARIFAVIDVWDALLSDRPYRKAWPKKKALDYIKAEAGKQFDPDVVTAFLEMQQKGYF